MASKKIVHIIDELAIGGANVLLVRLLAELRQQSPQDHHEVFCLFGPNHFSKDLQGFPVHCLELENRVRKKSFFRAIGILRQHVRQIQPDVVMAHLIWSRLLGLWAAKMEAVPRLLAFEHGDTYLNHWGWRGANFLAQFLPQKTVFCSHALFKRCRKLYGYMESRSEVIHNGIPWPILPEPPQWSREELAGPEAFVVVAVGSMGNGVDKGFPSVIEACAKAKKKIPHLQLWLVGDGPLRGCLEKLAEDRQIKANFFGKQENVFEIMRHADVFCHGAPFEPFGLVILEAMAVGLPVVAPRSGGIPEIIEDGVDGWLYRAGDTQSCQEQLVEAYESRTQSAQRASLGQNKVKKGFLISRFAQDIQSLYTSI